MVSSARAAPLWSSTLLAVLLWVCVEAHPGPSIPMTYCASINTADTPTNTSIYQSDGLCYNFCKADWALAIVQHHNCWCSNFVPDQTTQVDTSKCDEACPGYLSDVCGADGLFGYMLLQDQPSGTVSTGTAAPTASTSPSSSARVTETETVQNTVTYIPPSSSTSSSSTSSTSSSDSSATSSSTEASSDGTSTTQTPTFSVITAGGQTKTVTVTPPPTIVGSSPNSGSVSLTPDPSSHHGLSAGAAAGIAVAVVAVFIVAAGALAWLWIKRRRARREETAAPNFSSNRGSSAGMTASTPRTGEMSESRYYMSADNPPEPTRRRSTLMPVDPRLDPFAKGIYNRPENKSHESVNTIYDEQDYSRRIQDPPRVLRAVNPDSDVD